jgi:hypothetical protein
MLIKLFIITYRNDPVLNQTLHSLSASDIRRYDHEITVINNDREREVVIETDLSGLNVDFWTNCTRPPFSTGHLARNWNEAIINGVVDLDSPQCDYLVCCQNDILFKTDAFGQMMSHMQSYDFISYGAGDACHVHTASSLKKVGLFDERFCNIGHQETDYFYRQFLYNRTGCSINDYNHGKTWNVLNANILNDIATGWSRREPTHMESVRYHPIAIATFRLKWGMEYPQAVMEESVPANKQPMSPQFFSYPYFETKIPSPESRGYVRYA